MLELASTGAEIKARLEIIRKEKTPKTEAKKPLLLVRALKGLSVSFLSAKFKKGSGNGSKKDRNLETF